MPISKKIRFEVFKRDGFQCAYCGKTPPEVVLEIDHIEPVSKGGSDDINNLLTACFDCNRGKRNHRISKAPNQLMENLEILKEKEEQYKEYQKLARKINNRISREADKIDEIYNSYFNDYGLNDSFKNVSVKRFLKHLPFSEVEEAMHLACNKLNNSDKSIRYFCGICWNKIKGAKPPYEED